MRLTLRTLLAWLDDTLTPAEVRAIGKQVAESDFAKELVERIHKVTRQRRLTVPPRNGPDSVDANLVASYLDNELDPETVAEFEKRCLTSDVHLAEVASVHQVLSLIGQKAKVPVEARERMYQLIKGRESIRPKPEKGQAKRPVVREAVSEPVKPWVKPDLPPRRRLEQLGPIAAVLGLMAVLGWSAWVSLSPSTDRVAGVRSQKPDVKPDAKGAVENENEAKSKEEADDIVAAKLNEDSKKEKKEEEADAKPLRTFADGEVGAIQKTSGLFLRFDSEKKDWVRAVESTPIHEDERLLSLEPFRAAVDFPLTTIFLIGETGVTPKKSPPTLGAKLDLTYGSLVIVGTSPPLPFEISSDGSTLTVQPEADQIVGIERVTQRDPGKAEFVKPSFRFWVKTGTLKLLSSDGIAATLEGPGSVSLDGSGKWSKKSQEKMPAWVDSSPVAEEDASKEGKAFLALFRADRPLISSLVEACEDENPETARLAIKALRPVGDIPYIVPILNRVGGKTSTEARRSAIATLRDAISQSAEAAKQVREQLESDLGAGVGEATYRLLVGIPPESAGDLDTWSKLVKVLGTTDEADVGLRELALDNLKAMSGLGDLGYKAEAPEGDGLVAWQKAESDKRAKALNEADPAPKKPAK